MFLIIITGLPASGKTTLARRLAQDLQLPLITKDEIKELIFDTLGWTDREWSKKVGLASYTLMDYFTMSHLRANKSLIVESNFKPEFDNKKFQEWQRNYKFKSIQIICKADGEILFQRFKERVESGERHPGHVDGNNYQEFKGVLLNGKLDVLDLDGKIVEVNTNDFDKINYSEIISAIKSYLDK